MTFPSCTPEECGVQSRGILEFLDEMKKSGLHLHALRILRHGHVIAGGHFAPWTDESLHMLYSLSKSFTSTAVGFAVQEGFLRLDQRLVDLFPEKLPAAPCENMQKITVKHLLTMNSGHEVEPLLQGDDWEETFLRSYVPREPGSFFMYNTAATYMLSCIVEKVTGEKLIDYLRRKLFVPLGISEDAWFEESPAGHATGGFGLNVRIDDIAKLGQFILNEGAWEGVQLLDARWIRDAQQPWSDNSHHNPGMKDWNAGYGYQFWMCQPEGVFRGDGAFGQYCVVLPKQDMVIAIFSGLEDMQAVLQLLWDHLLPAVGDAPLTPGEDAAALEAALSAPVTNARWEDMGKETTDPGLEPAWEGSYAFAGNSAGIDRVRVSGNALYFTINGEETQVPLCRDAWQACTFNGGEGKAYSRHPGLYSHCAVRAARREEHLVLHLCFTETPFECVLKLTFSNHGLRILARRNAGFRMEELDLRGIKEG